MKERIKQDLERSFAAAPDTQKNRDLKEEILANVYEKYDDCLASGMSPEEAYRLTVSGIGDLSALFESEGPVTPTPQVPLTEEAELGKKRLWANLATACAVMLYILCLCPVILLLKHELLGICLMFAMIALATGILILVSGLSPVLVSAELSADERDRLKKRRLLRALILAGGVMLYILCVCPVILFVNHEGLGISLMFLMIALATVGIILRSTLLPLPTSTEADPAWNAPSADPTSDKKSKKKTPLGIFFSVLSGLYWALVIAAYFIYSFYTGKWMISWLIFLLAGFLYGVVHGIWQVIVGRHRVGAIIKIVICSILLIAILSPSVVLGDVNLDPFHFSMLIYDDNGYTAGGATLPSDAAVTNLDIEWSTGSVLVEYWDNDYILATESAEEELSDSEQMRHRVLGGTLSIKSQPSMFGFFISIPEKHLTVYLPRGTELSELRISAASGTLTVNGISAKQANIDSASAAISLSHCSFDSLDGDTLSGDLSFIGSARRIDLDTASGNINLTLHNTSDEIEIDSASGNAEITLPADHPGFRLEFDSASGDIVIPADARRFGDEITLGNGATEINMDSASGDLTIRLQ